MIFWRLWKSMDREPILNRLRLIFMIYISWNYISWDKKRKLEMALVEYEKELKLYKLIQYAEELEIDFKMEGG